MILTSLFYHIQYTFLNYELFIFSMFYSFSSIHYFKEYAYKLYFIKIIGCILMHLCIYFH